MALFSLLTIAFVIIFLLFTIRVRKVGLGVLLIILALLIGLLLRTISSLMEATLTLIAIAIVVIVAIIKKK